MEKIVEQPNLIRVCVDTVADGEISGHAHTMYQTKAFSFLDLWDLLRQCDAFFDEIDYPQAAVVRRHFFPVQAVHKKPQKPIYTAEQLAQQTGKAFSFFLAVDTRRGTTWQGRILEPMHKKELAFCSELELKKRIFELCLPVK